MNVYATFSGDRYHAMTRKIVEDAPKFGADRVLVYDDVWLRTKRPRHMAETAHFTNHPGVRGVNFFCFKPFVILDALDRVGPGDAVLFTDGDTFPVAHLGALFEIGARDGIMLFMANGWPQQKVWCKRDCFIIMGQDEPHWHDAHCAVARFMVFTHRHRAFLEEWLRYCLMRGCNTFDPSMLGQELPGFREHRCEQAILGNLAHKHGHRLYREACEYGDCNDSDAPLDRDLYPRLFSQGVSSWTPFVVDRLPRDDAGHYSSYFRNILD